MRQSTLFASIGAVGAVLGWLGACGAEQALSDEGAMGDRSQMPGPGCPAQEPKPGEPCTADDLTCTYPDTCNLDCDRRFTCTEGSWSSPYVCSYAVGCPGGPPQDGSPVACLYNQVSPCRYDACDRHAPHGPDGRPVRTLATVVNGRWQVTTSTCPDCPPGEMDSARAGVACGTHCCALDASGNAECWARYSREDEPPDCPLVQLDVGTGVAVGLGPDGSAVWWGNTGGTFRSRQGPFSEVSAGGDTVCALSTDGSAECWRGTTPQGTGATTRGLTGLTAGTYHACAISEEGDAVCWFHSATINQNHGQADAPEGPFLQLSAGDLHNCGVREDGSVACWGAGNLWSPTGTYPHYGQSIVPEGAFTQVSAGGFHSCGLLDDGELRCWGAGMPGSSGDRDDGQASPPDGSFVQVAAGHQHTCAAGEDGRVVCFGGRVQSPTWLTLW